MPQDGSSSLFISRLLVIGLSFSLAVVAPGSWFDWLLFIKRGLMKHRAPLDW